MHAKQEFCACHQKKCARHQRRTWRYARNTACAFLFVRRPGRSPPSGIFLPSTLSQRPDRRDEAATTERRAGSHGMGRAPPRAALTRHRRGAPRAPRSHVSALAVAPIAATRAARPMQAEVVRVSRCSMRHYLIFNFHCGFGFGPVISSIVFRLV